MALRAALGQSFRMDRGRFWAPENSSVVSNLFGRFGNVTGRERSALMVLIDQSQFDHLPLATQAPIPQWNIVFSVQTKRI